MCCCCYCWLGMPGELISRFFGLPTFSQEVEDFREGVYLELAAHGISFVAAWILQAGTLDSFSCSSFIPGGMRMWTSQIQYHLNMASPRLEDAIYNFCCFWNVAVYKHAKWRATASCPLFYHYCLKFCRDDSHYWWFMVWLILNGG